MRNVMHELFHRLMVWACRIEQKGARCGAELKEENLVNCFVGRI